MKGRCSACRKPSAENLCAACEAQFDRIYGNGKKGQDNMTKKKSTASTKKNGVDVIAKAIEEEAPVLAETETVEVDPEDAYEDPIDPMPIDPEVSPIVEARRGEKNYVRFPTAKARIAIAIRVLGKIDFERYGVQASVSEALEKLDNAYSAMLPAPKTQTATKRGFGPGDSVRVTTKHAKTYDGILNASEPLKIIELRGTKAVKAETPSGERVIMPAKHLELAQ